MTDVFVSYKAEDRARVSLLVDALEADGLSVWWDAHIGGGDDWRETIARQLDDAKCVIVVWSKRSISPEGRFVRDEAARALKRGTYLPVCIHQVDPPLGFGENQALALNGWKGARTDPRYAALLSAVISMVGIAPRFALPTVAPKGVSRRVLLGGGAVSVLAVIAGGWLFLRRGRAESDSIAVLPFANLSGDPAQAYFSDGMAEELRGALARIAGLKVIARTSSEMMRDADTKTAARKLDVANVLTGSVRRSPSTIRVTAQLIDGTTGIQRWSQDYDRAPGDTIKIQTDIAVSVAQAMEIALGSAGRAALITGGTNNVDAQKLVLQTDALLQSIFNEKRARRGLELVDAAIALDPSYAAAHARRGVLLNTISLFFSKGSGELDAGRLQALESANKAISLAPTLGWAHLALAQVKSGQLQIGPAWTEYRQALKLAPSDANTTRLYARFLAEIGRKQLALELADQAVALDPLSAESYNFRMFVLYRAGRYAEAERIAQDLLVRSPKLYYPPIEHGYCLIMLGQVAAARQFFAQAPPIDAGRSTGEAIILARSGDPNGALLAVNKLRRLIGDNSNYFIAQIYAQIGEPDEAFAALDRAFEVTDWRLIGLLTDPFMGPIRNNPRFETALKRLNYP